MPLKIKSLVQSCMDIGWTLRQQMTELSFHWLGKIKIRLILSVRATLDLRKTTRASGSSIHLEKKFTSSYATATRNSSCALIRFDV